MNWAKLLPSKVVLIMPIMIRSIGGTRHYIMPWKINNDSNILDFDNESHNKDDRDYFSHLLNGEETSHNKKKY